MKIPTLVLSLFCGLLQPLVAQFTVINEDFSSATDSTYGVDGNVLWAKNSGVRVNLAGGALVLTGSSTTTVQTQALVRFGATSLATGEVLTLTFDYAVSSLTSGALRIGLFDSHGTAIPANGTAGVDALVIDTDVGYFGWSGYLLQISPGGQGPTTATRFFSRIEDAVIPSGGNIGKSVLLTNVGATYYTAIGGNDTVASLPTSGTAQIGISRISDTEVGLDFWIEGTSLYTVVLTSAIEGDLVFDTLGLNLQGGGSNSGTWTIDNVNMTLAPIPEPSSTALLFGGLALVAGVILHRRSRA